MRERFVPERVSRLLHMLSNLRVLQRSPLQPVLLDRLQGPRGGGPGLPEGEGTPTLITPGTPWGGYDVVGVFRTFGEIPPAWRPVLERGEALGCLRVDLVRTGGGNNSGGEALLYVNGRAVQGIDGNHQEVVCTPDLLDITRWEIAIKAWSGVAGHQQTFGGIEWLLCDLAVDALYHTLRVLLDAVREIEEGRPEQVAYRNLLQRAYDTIDLRQPGSDLCRESIARALEDLRAGLASLPRGGVQPHVIGVGHSHIDVAWLWRLEHTREKFARTMSTVLHLMRQYPAYRFVQSQPALFDMLKTDYPEIYAEASERIREGRIEPIGGMWLEADCNVTGGESLVRQFLYGTRFFRQEFGSEQTVLWLPDVFGYSWALPQIIRQSGLRYFMTTKISWSQFNRFPFDTFRWRGIDGTEVLTHFITTPDSGNARYFTYNGDVRIRSVRGIWDNYQQKDLNDELLLSFGWGDGGGGPTREMLEASERLADLPGVPSFTLGPAGPFFDRLAERVSGNPHLPVWDGELYLEYHRGTYTSQAKTKRDNRQAEVLYHCAELFAAMCSQLLDRPYPHTPLDQGWKILLTHQFHDILPGSSIHPVYEDSARNYQEVRGLGEGVLRHSLTALASAAGPGEVVAFNPLPWARSDLVALPREAARGLDGQDIEEDGEPKRLCWVQDLPPNGYCVLRGGAPGTPGPLVVTPQALENPFFRIELDEAGQISRLLDKREDREVLPPGAKGNVLTAYEDRPMGNDAWDIDVYYEEKPYPVDDVREIAVVEQGPERGVLRIVRRFLDSRITQWLTIYARTPRIDFRTEVSWHQKQMLLRVAFPVDVRARAATYEVQFGNVERPNNDNTMWDYARFETCAHRWADLSEGGYGMSLLNDCKYGHAARGQVLSLSLIKSAVYPDPEADQGEHAFTYAIYPHAGDWKQGATTEMAYRLNFPLLWATGGPGPATLPDRMGLVECSATDHVAPETVKEAEDSRQLIVRCYEFGNRRGPVTLRFPFPVASARLVNLMEREPSAEGIVADGQEVTFAIRPYQIVTVAVERG